jgi:hypothetical protein
MLPLPFLNAMAKAPERTKKPLRFVALFKPNGVHPPSWNIEGGTEKEFNLSPMMKPFAAHKANLLFIDNMGTTGFSSHMASAQRFLSGRYAKGKAGSASIDQLIADKISPGSRHRSLELTTEGLFASNPECSYISYNANGQPIPRESDPQLIFDRLFRDPLFNKGQREEMISLLDRVNDHAKTLSKTLGRDDQQTLDQYLTIVRETEKKIGDLAQNGTAGHDFTSFKWPGVDGNFDKQVNLMIDVIALALWTDSTRCVSYMLGNDNSRMVFDFLGVKTEHHALSHYFRNFSRANLEALYKICLWHMEKFAYLLTRLKSYSDSETNLLDHTLVLYGAGMGSSDSHTAQRIPTVLAGATGQLKTGRYIRQDQFRELGSMHRALASIFGVELPEGHHLAQVDPLAGLDGSAYKAYKEEPLASSVEISQSKVTVVGRLRYSSDLDQANEFLVDVQSEAKPIRLKVAFKNVMQHNLPYFCGTPVRFVGQGERKGNEIVVTQVNQFESLAGLKPGSRRE